MSDERPILSQAALDALKEELEELKGEGREQMSQRLLEARELGDVSDSAEFESAKHDQALLEGRIRKLEDLIKNAVVREAPADLSVVSEGVAVTVRDTEDPDFTDTFVVANSEERAGGTRVLSPESPLGKAVIGKKVGDRVSYEAPRGTFSYEIVAIEEAE